MKKYTYYKVGLFISLLGFGTLTSCVNTRHCVNTNQNTRYHSLVNPTGSYSLHRFYQNNPVTAIAVKVVGGITVFGVVLLPVWLIGKHFTNQSSALTTGTCPVPGQGFMPPEWNMTAATIDKINEVEALFKKAVEKYKELGNPNEEMINSAEESFNNTIETQRPDWMNTFAVPYTISDPKVLDKETLENIKQAHFDLDLIKCLINKGVDPNAKDSQGFTLLRYAIIDKNKPLVDFLIKKGADVNGFDNPAKESPLAEAIEAGDKDIFELLVNNKADINRKDEIGGNFYLKMAALLPRVDMVELLLEKGVDPCKKDDKGKTVQDIVNALSLSDADKTKVSKVLEQAIKKLHPQEEKCPGA
ncbi:MULTISPECIES: ankyrin repeat domain-containing protein [Candidatus Cardinium]|uniref:ankyrin repeat domain-containing protein n=1 Tax=Candidatus Cardinium TaxID=273135 RepID=UPI001FA9D3A7|nr:MULTISPECIES: ankyrin repeat domain-containing protein [Cardinium]